MILQRNLVQPYATGNGSILRCIIIIIITIRFVICRGIYGPAECNWHCSYNAHRNNVFCIRIIIVNAMHFLENNNLRCDIIYEKKYMVIILCVQSNWESRRDLQVIS